MGSRHTRRDGSYLKALTFTPGTDVILNESIHDDKGKKVGEEKVHYTKEKGEKSRTVRRTD